MLLVRSLLWYTYRLRVKSLRVKSRSNTIFLIQEEIMRAKCLMIINIVLFGVIVTGFSFYHTGVGSDNTTGMAADNSRFLFLADLQPGMRGVGRTVIRSGVISEFAVEIVGIIDEPGKLSDFIVVRVSGEPIIKAGGVAQGMSGSPIYIDGKLIGALSRAAVWDRADDPIALITPIEGMMEIIGVLQERRFNEHENLIFKETEPIDLRLVAYRPSEVALKRAFAEAATKGINLVFAYPVNSPLMISGLRGRALSLLMDGPNIATPERLIDDFISASLAPPLRGLSSFGFTHHGLPTSIIDTGEENALSPLIPGGSIGVGLTTGDITIAALGTLTYIVDGLLVGFGHRFLHGGSTDFPLTSAYVYDTVESYRISFQLGKIGPTIGTIFEDRAQGIGGIVDHFPEMVDLSFAVRDVNREHHRNFSINLVDEPQLMAGLIFSTGIEALDSTLDRVGPGTVEVVYRIFGDGMPRPLERRDLFLSTTDIALFAPFQLALIANILQYNEFADPQITRIETSMEVREELRAAFITDFNIDRPSYQPGDLLFFEVELQTWRGERTTYRGALTIPEDAVGDFIIIRAFGGPRRREAGEPPLIFEDLDDLISAIEDIPAWDTITIEIFALTPAGVFLGRELLSGIAGTTISMDGYVVLENVEIVARLIHPEE
ncbi:TPA: hypothetical protein DD712_01665 [Candidatus Acetothermia bacterium]|nr:hypothetical protein [Candidatus Acetothermia bacterium]